MQLFKSFLCISIVCCLLQCPVELQANEVAKQNGTKTFGLNEISQNKTQVSHTADDLCGKSSQRTKTMLPEVHPSQGVWPWMALIGYSYFQKPYIDFKCQAVLISRQWVLTVASCVYSTNPFKPELVRLGVARLNRTRNHTAEQNDFLIDAIISHPQYSQSRYRISNDLALIRLKVRVNYTENIRPICLLSEPKLRAIREYYREKSIIIGAYNTVRYEYQSDDGVELTRWTTKILNQTDCPQRYSKFIDDSTDGKLICIRRTGPDVCDTTFGGALFFQNEIEHRFYLGGIASSGGSCFWDPPPPFTVVTHFIDWIIEITGENFF